MEREFKHCSSSMLNSLDRRGVKRHIVNQQGDTSVVNEVKYFDALDDAFRKYDPTGEKALKLMDKYASKKR
ncbi:MAG TPA: hypothetical protein VFG29_08565 [Syntrophales bacterium]|nr:hypothetical protein [Syntrophales bacterium]